VAVAFTSVIQPVRADWWERQARVAQSRGDVPASLMAAGQALAIDPLRLDTHYFLAGVLAQSPATASRQEAIQECLRIEELAPDYSDITYNLGQLYLAQDQPREALPCLQRAVQANPYDADKRILLGNALAALGRKAAAREQWEAALKLRPADPAIQGLLAQGPPPQP
jgi:tetratricopeptide (TPR) repeat protein